jgi:hypothetical protein
MIIESSLDRYTCLASHRRVALDLIVVKRKSVSINDGRRDNDPGAFQFASGFCLVLGLDIESDHE